VLPVPDERIDYDDEADVADEADERENQADDNEQ